MDEIVKLLRSSGQELLPCNDLEIAYLESRVSLKLPNAYKTFLSNMGHGAGTFMLGSSFFYNDLIDNQKYAQELLEEDHFPIPLPPDAFVFFMHQGYQFSFFRESDGDDPPVYYYLEGTTNNDFEKRSNNLTEYFLKLASSFGFIKT